MANLLNYRNNTHHGMSGGLGQKIQNIAKLAGTVKGIYDTSKAVLMETRPFKIATRELHMRCL